MGKKMAEKNLKRKFPRSEGTQGTQKSHETVGFDIYVHDLKEKKWQRKVIFWEVRESKNNDMIKNMQ